VDFVFDAPRPEVTTRPVGLTWDGTSLWLTTWYPFMLYRLDPATGAVLFSRSVTGLYPPNFSYAPEDLAWDGSHLWITDWFTGKIYELDPETFELLQTVPSPGSGSVGLTFHQGYLWNGDTDEAALFRLEVTDGTPTRRVTWGRLKRGVALPSGP
jgi:outer membrane protein assembly factor BamB